MLKKIDDQPCDHNPCNLIQPDITFFDEISSVRQPLEYSLPSLHINQYNIPDFNQPQEQPRAFTFNILEDQDPLQESVHLFYKLSEDFKEDQLEGNYCIEHKQLRKLQNDTKNIPKNFGKGIINFIEKNQKKFRKFIVKTGISYTQLLKSLKYYKKTINTIAQLRKLWTDEKIGKCMRIISNLFFRKYSLQYIFNSRISSFSTHIKYRQILWDALKNPYEFDHIKQY